MSKEPEDDPRPVSLTDEEREVLAVWAPNTLAELDRSREEWDKRQKEKRDKEAEEWFQSVMRALTEEGIRARQREAEWERERAERDKLLSAAPASPRVQ
jgi:hypothetical protein